MLDQENRQAFIESLSMILDLTRKSGAKGYEAFIRDVLTNLYVLNFAAFKSTLKYSNPRSWNISGFKDANDLKALKHELARLEKLMKVNDIAIGAWFFQNCTQLNIRLKEFD